jgi:adenine-specific DNA methylase
MKRLIEVDFPIRTISRRVHGERNVLSSLHQWWARRPIGACRAVICGALWPDPVDPECPQAFIESTTSILSKFASVVSASSRIASLCEADSWQKYRVFSKRIEDPTRIELRELLLTFIADYSSTKAASEDAFRETCEKITLLAHQTTSSQDMSRPLLFDPFAGGGSIPFEGLRCGADVFASDLNPIPVLINKMIGEWVPQYGTLLNDQIADITKKAIARTLGSCGEFYPEMPLYYLWARSIVCEGPGCGYTVPVLRSLWIEKSRSRSFAYVFKVDKEGIKIEILKNPSPSEVKTGTSKKASVTCPNCGFTTSRQRVQAQSNSSGLEQVLLAVVVDQNGKRLYRTPTEDDYSALEKAKSKSSSFSEENSVFNSELPYLSGIFNVQVYGINTWRKLYSDRQFLFLTEFSNQLKQVISTIEGVTDTQEKAIRVAMAFVLDRLAVSSCNVTRWRSDSGRMEGALSMMAMPMVWDWAEPNPFANNMALVMNCAEAVSESIRKIAESGNRTSVTEQFSATGLPLSDDSASLFFTDPPYYDYVPYANLADFYYPWLKLQLGHLFPFFDSIETPKDTEIVQLAERNPKYAHKTKEFFENQIKAAFSEARRITAPESIGVIVFAHKSTAVWETLLGAVIDSGWLITASWPIDTELTTRFKAIGTASLNSSIHLVCRPRENSSGELTAEIGDWRDVLRELPVRIHEWMPRLANEGVVGADAIFACLGPALEIFSRYSSVEKPNGETVTLREYLEHVWAAVAKEALNMIFAGADATGFEEDARLTAMWLWTLFSGASMAENQEDDADEEESDEDEGGGKKKVSGYVLEYDAARKIAQGLGAHLEDLDSIVEVKGDKARLVPVNERARELFGYESGSADEGKKKKKSKAQGKLFTEMEDDEYESTFGFGGAPTAGATILDKVHQAMLLFGAGRGEAVKRFLVDDGVGNDERFWRLSNALSALYPSGSQEKRWVDGILARKKGLGY